MNKGKEKTVKAMVEAGASNRQIADALGMKDPSGVSHYIRRHLKGVKRRRKGGWTEEERTRLKQMWASDMRMSEIEEAFAYKRSGNIRKTMSEQMYRMRLEGRTDVRRTINGVRREGR